MKILINASNLGPGGASQVADSICRSLDEQKQDEFIVVLPERLKDTADAIGAYENVKVYIYTFKNTWISLLLARDKFLDQLVKMYQVDVVFSVFAPTWWSPRCPHLCGFALAHLVMSESPFFKRLSFKDRFKQNLNIKYLTYFYKRSSKYYYTENKLITERIRSVLNCKRAYTVTNYYNQVFDRPALQKFHKLPDFSGISLLTVSSFYPHKNLEIAIDIAKLFHKHHPEINVRFVFTIDKSQFSVLPDYLEKYFLLIGKVDIAECPSLYQQCTFAFQPTLLECFTATYPEAMRAGRPIITTDLEFARGLCGEAAVYYAPISAEDAYNKILSLYKDKDRQNQLVQAGQDALKEFDSYSERINRIINLCKEVYNDCKNSKKS